MDRFLLVGRNRGCAPKIGLSHDKRRRGSGQHRVFTVSRLLLNCDIGESFGNWTMGLDAEVMPFIDCANIACGFHAGDPSIMRKTVALALQHGVQIGAHPAYQDLQGFGRRSMAYTPEEIQDL
eukprot:gene10033-12731_t